MLWPDGHKSPVERLLCEFSKTAVFLSQRRRSTLLLFPEAKAGRCFGLSRAPAQIYDWTLWNRDPGYGPVRSPAVMRCSARSSNRVKSAQVPMP